MRARTSPKKLAGGELFEYAVRYLAQRAASSAEVQAKLRMKAATLADVDAVVARLKDVGYLDDRRFAESFAANRAQNEGFGRTRILSDLRGRRVSPSMADRAVDQALEGKNEGEMIESFIERRMPSLRNGGRIEDQKELARAWRRLRRAGFSSGGSLSALKRLAARPEEIEEPLDEESEDTG